MQDLLLSLRPKHWVKNLLIFAPLIFAKKLFLFPDNLKAAGAFFLFSLAASAVYLINDILDYEQDKIHPTKCFRPIASDKISLMQAKTLALILSIAAIVASFRLNMYLGWIVTAYVFLNIVYSKILKKIVIIDVICIGVFFLLRIIAGSAVIGVQMSIWIIVITFLLALFLGLNKRRQELGWFKQKSIFFRDALNTYNISFIDRSAMVIASSIAIIYTLYTVDARTAREFGGRQLAYSIPFVYYGIFRYFYLIHNLNKDGDPTNILFSDKKMQINLALWITVCIFIIYFGR